MPEVPATPPTDGATPPPNAEAPPTRRAAIPAKEVLTKTRKLMRDVFAKDLADRSSGARRALARRLIDEALKSDADSGDRFVLFAGAIEASKEAGNVSLGLEAANGMADAFEVDRLALRSEAAERSLAKSAQANLKENVYGGLDVLDELQAAGDLAGAGRIGSALRQAAKEPSLKAVVQKRLKMLDETKAALAKMTQDVAKLKQSPNDPAATLSAGRYYCFYAGDWGLGLPFLSRGSNAALAALANRELARPGDAPAQADLADAWAKAGAAESGRARAAVMGRSLHWYRKALPGVAGIRRAAVQRGLWAASRAASDPQVTAFRFVTDAPPPCLFALQDTEAPDELSAVIKPTEWRISGVRQDGSTTTIKGGLVGHFGKAILVTAHEAGGTLEVGVPSGTVDQTTYRIVSTGIDGKVRHKRVELERGKTYAWSIAETDAAFVMELRDKDKLLATLSEPKGRDVAFGWGATCRHAKEQADLIVRPE